MGLYDENFALRFILSATGPYTKMEKLLKNLMGHFNWKRVAIITSTDDIWQIAANLVKIELTRHGIEVAHFHSFIPGRLHILEARLERHADLIKMAAKRAKSKWWSGDWAVRSFDTPFFRLFLRFSFGSFICSFVLSFVRSCFCFPSVLFSFALVRFPFFDSFVYSRVCLSVCSFARVFAWYILLCDCWFISLSPLPSVSLHPDVTFIRSVPPPPPSFSLHLAVWRGRHQGDHAQLQGPGSPQRQARLHHGSLAQTVRRPTPRCTTPKINVTLSYTTLNTNGTPPHTTLHNAQNERHVAPHHATQLYHFWDQSRILGTYPPIPSLELTQNLDQTQGRVGASPETWIDPRITHPSLRANPYPDPASTQTLNLTQGRVDPETWIDPRITHPFLRANPYPDPASTQTLNLIQGKVRPRNLGLFVRSPIILIPYQDKTANSVPKVGRILHQNLRIATFRPGLCSYELMTQKSRWGISLILN